MTEAVINQNQQAQAFSPFGKRNANKDRIEQEEAELKRLAEDKNNPPEGNDGDDSNLPAEEKSFKKRYGDLRRHSQQQQVALQKQIDDLRQLVELLPDSSAMIAETQKIYTLVSYTVATLPAGKVGMRAYVTDATAPTYNTALVGGGAITAPVFHNGAAWVSA